MPTAAVIGAGPVGCLTALGLQKRGYDVVVFEGRSEEAFAPSMARLTGKEEGTSNGIGGNAAHPLSRSINLAISVRGLTALESVDPRLARIVLENAVPMRARMIHQNTSSKGKPEADEHILLDSQAYSTQGECINSVSRLLLSRLLLDEVLAHDIPVRWSHKLRSLRFASSSNADLERTRLQFDTHTDTADSPEHVDFDVVFGCDGHHSHVRRAMQAACDLQVEETTIDNYYVELHIPALVEKGEESATNANDASPSAFAFDPNHLHIWPRHDYMLIALANRDGSFTSTLFAPQRIFDQHLQDADAAVAFFAEQFPDALRVIGAQALVQQVCGRKPSSLGMVRCSTYHLDGQALLLGDSAHAMVPFYGQGLNCGLEDVRIMLQLLDREEAANSKTHSPDARRRAFEAYSAERHADLLAINQLAIDNFTEMSSGVVRRGYIVRKRIDAFLERHLPHGWWNSLYTNVTFSNIGYATARKHEARQVALLQTAMSGVAVGTIVGAAFALSRAWSAWHRA